MYRLILFLCFVSGCILPVDNVFAKPVDRVMDASVQLSVVLPFGEVPIGSGTLVRDDDMGLGILTAQHVAEALDGFTYRACRLDDDTNCIVLGSYIMDSRNDLAGDWAFYPIKEAPKKSRPAKIGKRPKIGDDLILAGIPNGSPLIVEGSVSWDAGPGLVVHGFAYPGSSGGGVFNEDGELIGLTVAIPILHDPLGFPTYETSLPLVVPIQNIPFLVN